MFSSVFRKLVHYPGLRPIRSILVIPLVLLIALLLFACTPSSDDVTLPDLPDGWTRIEPGGETRCVEDTPFAFWVRPGTSNNLLVYFRGGGSCWDEESCESGNYVDAVSDSPIPDFPTSGIFDFENADNPFLDYYMVLIPVCSGDPHFGDKVVEYSAEDGSMFTIEHRGYNNASSATKWVFDNFSAPESIFVTGCSMGGYGSILHAPFIIRQYPESRITQLSDSAAGIAPQKLNYEEMWGLHRNFPGWIPALQDLTPGTFDLSEVYIAIASHYPEHVFSQFVFLFDGQLMSGYISLGGSKSGFLGLIADSLTGIHAAAPNFRSYTTAGFQHCILGAPNFYELQTGGVLVRDWVADLAASGTVDNIQPENGKIDFGK